MKNDAVPSKWPNVPNYVSKIPSTSRPTTTATSTAREAAKVERDEISHLFSSLEEMKNKLDKSILSDGAIDLIHEEDIQFISTAKTGEPKIKFVLRIWPNKKNTCVSGRTPKK